MSDVAYHVISHHPCPRCNGRGYLSDPAPPTSWLERHECPQCRGDGFTARTTDLLTALEALKQAGVLP